MPYIKTKKRPEIFACMHQASCSIRNVGELNYAITQLCKLYLEDNQEKYQTYNDIIGVLECAKLELYRRKIANYEDQKIKENGDV